jgi:hypothetical protein
LLAKKQIKSPEVGEPATNKGEARSTIDRSTERERFLVRYSSHQMKVSSPKKTALLQVICARVSGVVALRASVDDQADDLINPTVDLGR